MFAYNITEKIYIYIDNYKNTGHSSLYPRGWKKLVLMGIL